MATARTDRYALPMVVLHWLMLVILAAVLLLVEWLHYIPKDDTAFRGVVRDWHKSLGLLVLALVWVRLALRLVTTTPPITPAPPRWQRWAGNAVHVALYAVMIATPIAGWLMSNANGRTAAFFGLVLPALLAENKPLARQIYEVHETLGHALMVLVGIHAAAGLFHHYVQKDNTLARMLPGPRRAG
jgi:superoxide oxidase